MTPEQERAEARIALEAATPGPWRRRNAIREGYFAIEGEEQVEWVASSDKAWDAHLIANAPTWLSNSMDREEQLIAENERLKHEAEYSDLMRLEALKLYDIINKHSAEQNKEIQYRKKYEGFLKSCIACGESLEKTGYDKFEYWLENYLLTIKIPNEVEAEG